MADAFSDPLCPLTNKKAPQQGAFLYLEFVRLVLRLFLFKIGEQSEDELFLLFGKTI